jgi:hypothetical protein
LDFKPPNADFLPSQPSPSVNSLRKAMNPYLGDLGSPQRNRDSHVPYEQQQTRFSPGYRPHKDATVRAVKPDSREGDSTPPSSRGEPMVRNQQKLPSTDSNTEEQSREERERPVRRRDETAGNEPPLTNGKAKHRGLCICIWIDIRPRGRRMDHYGADKG